VGTHTASGVTVNDTAVVNVTVTTPPVSDPGNNPSQPVAQEFIASDPFVTKIANPPFAIPGEPVTFIFYVSNPGTVPANNVVAIDPIPSAVEILSATAPTGTTTISGQDVIFSINTLQPGETITITIETRVRPEVATPFTIINEVCMNADNMPEQRCDTATVLSVTALPATGETPIWSLILQGLLMIGGAVLVTATGWMGYRFLNLRNTSV